MKKQGTRGIHPTIIMAKHLIMLLLLIVNTTALQAQGIVAVTADPVTQTALVKHLGNVESNMFFQVQVDNAAGEKFMVVIKDREGTTLFQQVYTDKKFSKKFQLPKIDQEQITFIIKGARNNIVLQKFEVNSSTRVVEEVIVKKMS